MSYQTYEFTAFEIGDLRPAGEKSVDCGETFTMPGEASLCFSVTDNDPFLSGDSCHNENADDHYGQHASIEGDNGEVGNGGQIYAESYFWVYDEHGNWYVLVEIEQEGSNENYYTFYEGHGYSVPAAGTHLTVHSECNVTSDFLDYKCLDAGEKVATGSISGTVFCDTDCDGLQKNFSVVEGKDYTIEAEDMHEKGFHTTHSSNASGGEILKLNKAGGNGDIWTNFHGESGTYDFRFFIQDESDGRSVIKLKINGQFVEAIKLNKDSDGGGNDHGPFSEFVIEGVELNQGDEILLWVDGDHGEFVRFDKLVLEGQDELRETGVEPVKEGVTVKLVDLDGNVVEETQTDAHGNYSFDNVPAGDYKVMGVAPDGTEFTIQDAGNDDSIDSDVDANGMSGVISVGAGDNIDIDLGLKDLPFEVCDDPNAVKIDFEGFAAGTVINSQYAGVTISAQRDRNNTPENDAMVFDSANPTGGDTDLATDSQGNILIVSEDNDSNDPDDAIGGQIVFEFAAPASVFDLKVIDTEEGGTITLKDADGNVIATFDIPNIGDGEIDQVVMDVDGVSEMIVDLDGSGAIDDLCYVPAQLGALEGRYFCDENGNDVDDSEPGVEGAIVFLLKGGEVIAETTTNANGEYRFDDLVAGDDYSVLFEDPDSAGQVGKEFVAQDAGNDDTVDSDTDSSGLTGAISVNAGETTSDVDAGIADPGTASLAGRVFCDENDNSVDDAEPGVGGVTVRLLDADGNELATTETAADGSYEFTGLAAGDYKVDFPTVVDGKVLVDSNQGGDDTIDSDADQGTGETGIISLGIGERSEDNDAGVEDPGTAIIAGRYFCDENDNDVEDAGEAPIVGAAVELLNAAGEVIATTTTDDAGDYVFAGLDAGTYSVRFAPDADGKAFVAQDDPNGNGDDTNDSDVNGNGETGPITVGIGERSDNNDAGVEDPGTASLAGRVFCDENDNSVDDAEPGVGGVTVRLLDADGNELATTETAADGSYEFTGLAAGDYKVDFPTVVDGKVLVDSNQGGDDTIDSDADQGTGETGIISLGIGERSEDNDAGVEDPGTASLAGRVFCDENDNSVDDAEPGVGGVTVRLLDADGNELATTETAADGSYEFTGLAAGDYKVDFPTVVDGKVLVDSNQGGDDTIDSDADQGTGETGIISLGIGERSEDNDAGVEDPGTAAISGRYFCDDDDDATEANVDTGLDVGIADALVTLLDADGNTVATTRTDSSGNYIFTGLMAGTYSVLFAADASGKVFVAPDAGDDDAIDSDVDADGMTGPITIEIGDLSEDNDAGVKDPGTASLGDKVFIDANGNGLQDGGEVGVDDVRVVLLDGDGNELAETLTANGGMYLFDGLDAGDYRVRFDAVDNFDFTTQDAGDDALDSDANVVTGETDTVSLAIGEENLTIDAGIISQDPDAMDDAGKACADETITIDVLANDVDAEPLTITEVNGQAIVEGGASVDVGGVLVSLVGGQLVFDGVAEFADLEIGDTAIRNITYTVEDGLGGSDMANVELTFCGALNTVDTIADILPTSGTATLQRANAGNIIDAYTMELDGTGDVRLDGLTITEAYCLDGNLPFDTRVPTEVNISVANEANALAIGLDADAAANMDLVNWIVNQDFFEQDNGDGTGDTYTDLEVQEAIWLLLNGETFFINDPDFAGVAPDDGDGVREEAEGEIATLANAQEIVDAALTFGEGFEAVEGQQVGLILDPVDPAQQEQPFIVTVSFNDWMQDCVCV